MEATILLKRILFRRFAMRVSKFSKSDEDNYVKFDGVKVRLLTVKPDGRYCCDQREEAAILQLVLMACTARGGGN